MAMLPAAQKVFDLLRRLRDRGSISEEEMDELLDATAASEREFCASVYDGMKKIRGVRDYDNKQQCNDC